MIYFGTDFHTSNFRSASRGALHSPTFVYQVCALRCATTAVLNITGLAAVFASLSLSLLSNSPCFCGFWLWCCLLGCDIAAGQNCFCKTIKMILCWIFIQAREFPLPYWPTDWNAKLGSGLAAGRKLLCFWGPTKSTCCPSLDTSCGYMFSSFTASIEKEQFHDTHRSIAITFGDHHTLATMG